MEMAEFDFQAESWMEQLSDSLLDNPVEEGSSEYGVRVFGFEKLLVWKKSIDFVEWIYLVTAHFPGEEKFVLTSQIKKSAISISSNIAEGSSRGTPKDRSHFLNIAYSSCIELMNQLIIAFRLKFLSMNQYAEAQSKIQELTAMLYSLRKSWREGV